MAAAASISTAYASASAAAFAQPGLKTEFAVVEALQSVIDDILKHVSPEMEKRMNAAFEWRLFGKTGYKPAFVGTTPEHIITHLANPLALEYATRVYPEVTEGPDYQLYNFLLRISTIVWYWNYCNKQLDEYGLYHIGLAIVDLKLNKNSRWPKSPDPLSRLHSELLRPYLTWVPTQLHAEGGSEIRRQISKWMKGRELVVIDLASHEPAASAAASAPIAASVRLGKLQSAADAAMRYVTPVVEQRLRERDAWNAGGKKGPAPLFVGTTVEQVLSYIGNQLAFEYVQRVYPEIADGPYLSVYRLLVRAASIVWYWNYSKKKLNDEEMYYIGLAIMDVTSNSDYRGPIKPDPVSKLPIEFLNSFMTWNPRPPYTRFGNSIRRQIGIWLKDMSPEADSRPPIRTASTSSVSSLSMSVSSASSAAAAAAITTMPLDEPDQESLENKMKEVMAQVSIVMGQRLKERDEWNAGRAGGADNAFARLTDSELINYMVYDLAAKYMQSAYPETAPEVDTPRTHLLLRILAINWYWIYLEREFNDAQFYVTTEVIMMALGFGPRDIRLTMSLFDERLLIAISRWVPQVEKRKEYDVRKGIRKFVAKYHRQLLGYVESALIGPDRAALHLGAKEREEVTRSNQPVPGRIVIGMEMRRLLARLPDMSFSEIKSHLQEITNGVDSFLLDTDTAAAIAAAGTSDERPRKHARTEGNKRNRKARKATASAAAAAAAAALFDRFADFYVEK